MPRLPRRRRTTVRRPGLGGVGRPADVPGDEAHDAPGRHPRAIACVTDRTISALDVTSPPRSVPDPRSRVGRRRATLCPRRPAAHRSIAVRLVRGSSRRTNGRMRLFWSSSSAPPTSAVPPWPPRSSPAGGATRRPARGGRPPDWATPAAGARRGGRGDAAAGASTSPGHRSTTLTAPMVAEADLVVGMSLRHVQESVLLEPSAWERTFRLKELVRRGEFVGPRLPGQDPAAWVRAAQGDRDRTSLAHHSPEEDVADPYGGPLRRLRGDGRRARRPDRPTGRTALARVLNRAHASRSPSPEGSFHRAAADGNMVR